VRILVIEDDRLTGLYIADGLREEGHVVDLLADGAQGPIQAATGGYDVLIVDRMLPSLDGVALVRTLRGRRRRDPRHTPALHDAERADDR
jgi:two-component system, OmpR family, response regulator